MIMILSFVIGIVIFGLINFKLNVVYFGFKAIIGLLLTCIVFTYFVFARVLGLS